jgi:hypothetical protein
MATEKSRDVQERAEAQFQKRERALREGEAVRAEYAAASRAVDVKTARLKSLRLAKEASDAEAEAEASREAAPKKKRKKADS